ncbi:MAG: esterase/lipase family protein, partial [Blastocatellia bacterium]
MRRILSPSKKQSTLTCLSEGSSFTGEIIFVHGMDGDAEKTWVAANGKSSWAEWLKEDRPDLRIWSFGYPASSSAWVGSAMQLHDRAINFLAHLQSNGLGEKPTCFITHSLGGLVVKQLLHEALVFSPKSHKSIAGKVRGVVFIATPHIGSILAAFVYKLKYLTRPTWVITDLTPSRQLQRLNDWYRDHVAKAKIKTLVFRENEPTHGLATVVNFISADANIPGVTTIAIDSDHINICKPTDKKAPIYSRTLKFLEEVLPRTHKKFHVPHQENQTFTDREEI